MNNILYRMCPPGEIKYFYSIDNNVLEYPAKDISILDKPLKVKFDIDVKTLKEKEDEIRMIHIQ